MKETELAQKVVEWLKIQHWEVYQEVEPQTVSGIADIVAINDNLSWIVEVKTSLSLTLLEQIYMWRGYANYISIAVPRPKKTTKGRRVAELFLRNYGIGMIVVGNRNDITHKIWPRLNRKISKTVIDNLNEHQKDYAEAGNADGRRWTPFQHTCSQLLCVVKRKPGIELKEALDEIKHHYRTDSTARSCLVRYLNSPQNIVKGVRMEREGKSLKLYPK